MNPNLFVWTSDWHVVSDDVEHGLINETRPTDAGNLAAYIASLQPAGVIDLGDCKDHYGPGNEDEHDRYIEKVRNVLPWATSSGTLFPILPGNHDELNDYGVAGSDFSPFNAKFWGPPYHFTCDWPAPKIRFIAHHSRIVHAGDTFVNPGFFAVDVAERQWFADEIAALPHDWQAIICSHAPLNPVFGNNIGHWSWLGHGGTEIQKILRDNSSRIAAHLSGHRHLNMATATLDGILHISGPGVSYTLNNGYGGWVPIEYAPATRTLTFDFRLGPPSAYPRVSGYTPIVVQLPALTEPPPPPPPTPLEEALTELKLTTVGYINDSWTDPPEGTHWRNALDILETV